VKLASVGFALELQPVTSRAESENKAPYRTGLAMKDLQNEADVMCAPGELIKCNKFRQISEMRFFFNQFVDACKRKTIGQTSCWLAWRGGISRLGMYNSIFYRASLVISLCLVPILQPQTAAQTSALLAIAPAAATGNESRLQLTNFLDQIATERTAVRRNTIAAIITQTQTDSFRMEKVIFESQPGYRVTAVLSLPDSAAVGKAKLPAIVVAPDHGPNRKDGRLLARC
jgi:hypothetical protein